METETIGSRIRAARKEMGYSQEELAALLYMKKTTICKYEKDLHDILQIAKPIGPFCGAERPRCGASGQPFPT